jgi:UPF0716 protein FxsA
MRLVWLLLAWTMVEIGLFASIGGQIGILATWAVVLGSAVGGIWLIRWQKRNLAGDVLGNLQSLRAGVNSAAHSALIVLAGLLLILPGFLTDFLGLVLLIPWVQNWIIADLSRRATTAAVNGTMGAMRHMHRGSADDVIDAQVIDVTPPGDNSSKP